MELEPMKYEIETAIKTLAQQAEKCQGKADEAMKYSQAALNLTHVVAMLSNNQKAVGGGGFGRK